MPMALRRRWSKDLAAVQKLKRVLARRGYFDTGLEPAIGPWNPQLPDDSAPATRRNTLVRLFWLGQEVAIPLVRDAVQPLDSAELARGGILELRSAAAISLVQLQPYRDLLLVVDRPTDHESENVVMLASRSSLELAHHTVRRRSRNALDLGTGCGLLAMLAATHSEQVYALDLNPKAIEVAEFNCRVNGIGNVACMQGNLFEPVRNRRFDLIVSNPPFVVSPASRLVYRDSGVDGDEFCLKLAEDGARMLTDGGILHMALQWVHVTGRDWRDTFAERLGKLGCDTWCMCLATHDPEEHIAEWVTAYDAGSVRAEWRRYLKRRRINAVSTGLLTLRRRSARRNFISFDDAPDDRNEPYGDAVATLFDIRQYLHEISDSALLREKLVAGPEVVRRQESRFRRGTWETTSRELVCGSGLKYRFCGLDPLLERVVSACDGKHTLQQVFQALAAQDQAYARELAARYIAQVRGLAAYGVLVPLAVAKRSAQRARAQHA